MYSVKVHVKGGVDRGKADKESAGTSRLAKDLDAAQTSEKDVDAIRFSSGNPRIDITSGVVHIFRDTSVPLGMKEELPRARTEHLCILAVPSHMTGSDFCHYTGAFLPKIREMRIVRNDSLGNVYMVLMRFDSQQGADDFHQEVNGKPFSSLNPEQICHAVFTADVHYTESIEAASTPPIGLTEMPTCPVCLERLDHQISGVLTTVCNHSFHSACISKWGDSTCPVCRYCQQPPDDSTCTVCGTGENLWMCLLCGYIGCGRYQKGHALDHWEETGHCYALELGTQMVWDYVGDNYVHRLIMSKTDGEPVELETCGGRYSGDGLGDVDSCPDPEMEEALINSKIDSVALEYNQLLCSQLDSQRQYYEALLAEAHAKMDDVVASAVEKSVSMRLQRMEERARKLEKEKKDLQALNEHLVQIQIDWRKKLQQQEEREKKALHEKDGKLNDLEEQVRDLMVFIEAQKVLEIAAGNGLDVREGTVMSVPSAPSSSNKGRGSRRGRGR